MSERLGPCRKCGGAGVFCCSSDGEAEWIRCQNCGYESAVHYKIEEVLASWNAPAPAANSTDPAPIEEIGSHIGNGGQFDPTDPTLRLAREITFELYKKSWGTIKVTAEFLAEMEKFYFSGEADNEVAVQAALEGIRRASEMQDRRLVRAAQVVADGDFGGTAMSELRAALRQFEHLKG